MRQLTIHANIRCWTAALITMVMAGCAEHVSPPDHLVTGQPFPALNVSDMEGKAAVLAAERGKLVVLNVWATWCAACRKELPSLQRLSNDLDAQRFEVIGLSLDNDAHDVREYLIDKGVSYANFMDPTMHAADQVLGVKVYPYTFFIGPGGEMLGRKIGTAVWDDPKVIAALEAAYHGDSAPLAALTRH